MSEAVLREKFRRNVSVYKSLGVNPMSLATGCSVKVDLVSVLYPAISTLRGKLEKMKIAPRRDAYVFPATEVEVLERRIYGLDLREEDVEDLRRLRPARAVVLSQVSQELAGSAEKFSQVVERVYSKVADASPGLEVGKGHSIVTTDEKAQFFIFDFVKQEGSELQSLTVANNDTIQVIDPTEEPGDYRQSAIAVGNSLNDLYALGAWRELKVYPVIDAPTEELRGKIEVNYERYVEEVGGVVVGTPQPHTGTLLMGATVVARMSKKPPFFFDQIKEGMEIMITRPMGDLAPINVYMVSMMDQDLVNELKSFHMTVEDVARVKEQVLETLKVPNLPAAKAIEEFLPALDEEFDPYKHIAATTDVSGPGVYVIRELAELAHAEIELWDVPLTSPELSEFATRNFIIPNGTSGTNGSLVIVASSRVLDELEGRLKGAYQPVRIGKVKGRGEPLVVAPRKLANYVMAESYLKGFELK
ncbi:selenophosphate synthetase [Sulfodiicoccus acidiphilus]|uniref:Selenophosphate synthetase n=1 Tax=Sulfodiicoccus acidiphilus TaxID=1670455 RepID=A0A348B251_9CREN|nr:SelD-related putative sulfur metabolism protein [Sulfodiicoccus acidiphilus]BBD72253.1 selenophosphate synthetase [Sulfodiicoccus acidiphilus]GGT90764.1 selenophosphate synthetase [Sulfodiicoccus acidiphilus]